VVFYWGFCDFACLLVVNLWWWRGVLSGKAGQEAVIFSVSENPPPFWTLFCEASNSDKATTTAEADPCGMTTKGQQQTAKCGGSSLRSE
jgi:hypothetical protein